MEGVWDEAKSGCLWMHRSLQGEGTTDLGPPKNGTVPVPPHA